jgi:hypothetical protein
MPAAVSSPCPVSGLSPGPSCCLPEGGGAPERRKSQLGTFVKAPACRLTGRRAFRRSTAAICYAVTVLLRRTGGIYRSRYPGSIGAALHPTSRSHLRQPPHRGRTVTAPPGTWLRNPRLQAPPSPLRHRTSPEDALSEQGWCTPYVRQGRCQIGTPRLQGPSTVAGLLIAFADACGALETGELIKEPP